jgi:predicted CXXCH cytochrome family protein
MSHRYLFLVAVCCLAQDADSPAILRPTDKSAIPAGPFAVVARRVDGAKLLLDGKALEKPEAMNAMPGIHELTLGKDKVKFAVVGAGAAAPDGFRTFRSHPSAATCDTCHKESTPAASCMGCHDSAAFPKKHDHNTEVLKDCGWCHSPHGSTEASHLKMPKEKACKLCHG